MYLSRVFSISCLFQLHRWTSRESLHEHHLVAVGIPLADCWNVKEISLLRQLHLPHRCARVQPRSEVPWWCRRCAWYASLDCQQKTADPAILRSLQGSSTRPRLHSPCAAGYSGCAGVFASGDQFGSAFSGGMPSPAWIAVTGHQKLKENSAFQRSMRLPADQKFVCASLPFVSRGVC
jgi:hypothetical protein